MSTSTDETPWINPLVAIVERLAALDDKRLMRGTLWDDFHRCGCAIGSIMPPVVQKRTPVKKASLCAYLPGERYASPVVDAWVTGLGLTRGVISLIETINDAGAAESPEARYIRVVERLTKLSKLSRPAFEEVVR